MVVVSLYKDSSILTCWLFSFSFLRFLTILLLLELLKGSLQKARVGQGILDALPDLSPHLIQRFNVEHVKVLHIRGLVMQGELSPLRVVLDAREFHGLISGVRRASHQLLDSHALCQSEKQGGYNEV